MCPIESSYCSRQEARQQQYDYLDGPSCCTAANCHDPAADQAASLPKKVTKIYYRIVTCVGVLKQPATSSLCLAFLSGTTAVPTAGACLRRFMPPDGVSTFISYYASAKVL